MTWAPRLFERLPDLALAGPGPLPHRSSNFISGLETLPVTYTPTDRIGSAGSRARRRFRWWPAAGCGSVVRGCG
jgi:hypothetical protein